MQPSILKPEAPQGNEKFRVLVVEDDAAIAKLLLSSLNSIKLDCRHAGDGVAALEAFKAHDPHLVLLYIGLPRMTGDQVCSKIRETSMVPIIMLTAQNADEEQLSGFKMGADDYVPKPFSPKILLARVMANLRRAYRYDTCPDPISAATGGLATASNASNGNGSSGSSSGSEAATPPGWANCDRCGYMGPRSKFEYEDATGRRTTRCPVCKESDHVIFSIG